MWAPRPLDPASCASAWLRGCLDRLLRACLWCLRGALLVVSALALALALGSRALERGERSSKCKCAAAACEGVSACPVRCASAGAQSIGTRCKGGQRTATEARDGGEQLATQHRKHHYLRGRRLHPPAGGSRLWRCWGSRRPALRLIQPLSSLRGMPLFLFVYEILLRPTLAWTTFYALRRLRVPACVFSPP